MSALTPVVVSSVHLAHPDDETWPYDFYILPLGASFLTRVVEPVREALDNPEAWPTLGPCPIDSVDLIAPVGFFVPRDLEIFQEDNELAYLAYDSLCGVIVNHDQLALRLATLVIEQRAEPVQQWLRVFRRGSIQAHAELQDGEAIWTRELPLHAIEAVVAGKLPAGVFDMHQL